MWVLLVFAAVVRFDFLGRFRPEDLRNTDGIPQVDHWRVVVTQWRHLISFAQGIMPLYQKLLSSSPSRRLLATDLVSASFFTEVSFLHD